MHRTPLFLSLAAATSLLLSPAALAQTSAKPAKPAPATAKSAPAATRPAPAVIKPTPDPAKPLTEGDLIKTIDKLGSGDPVRANPLDSVAAPATPAAKEGKTDKGDKADRSKNGETEITAEEGSFDQHTHQAIFEKHVFVKNPDFSVKCDKLTAYMKHDDEKAAGGAAGAPKAATPAPVATPAPAVAGATPRPASKGGGNSGALDRAVAEGNVEIVQDKVETDGSITHNVGHSRHATYDAKTGDVVLKGNPDVQTGINTCVSLDDSTVMTLNRAGQMRVVGPHKTVIRDTGADPTTNGH